MWLSKILSLPTRAEMAPELAKGCKAWEEFPVQFDSLRERLTQRYKRHQKLWKTGRNPESAATLAFSTSKVCWDCGDEDHMKGDASCNQKGQLNAAPDWIKEKEANRGNGKGKSKSHQKDKKDTPCRFYARGHCKNGERCDFAHDKKNKGKEK